MVNIKGHFVTFVGNGIVRPDECSRPDDPCLAHHAYQCVVCGETFLFCPLAGCAVGQGSHRWDVCSDMGATLAEILLRVVEQGGKFDPHCEFKRLFNAITLGNNVIVQEHLLVA